MTANAPALDADLVAGLKRLKLAKVRAIAPEVLQTARTQRWKPEEVLRVLVDAEIAARDDSNARTRLRAAGFPVTKTLDEFNTGLSSVPQSTFDYLASLEWIRAAENLCLVGPAGTGKSHLLLAVGHAAVTEGMRVRYFAAADLVENLYRGLADNSVAKIIDSLLRADLIIIDELGFAPLDLAGTQLLFRFVAAAYERRSLGIASHWPFDAWGRFLFQVLYAIGASLACMPLLRRLGDRAMVAIGLALALGSELLIGGVAAAGLLDRLPIALLLTGGFFFQGKLVVAYPLFPWLGMMCLGWAFGRRMVRWRAEGKGEAKEASRLLAIAGAIGLVLFFALRAANGFGNMRLLRAGGGLVQWLHVSKYPPSATYVGLELGIGAWILAALMRWGSRMPRALEPLRLLGQTALFYYLLHIHVLKLAAWSTGLEGRLGVGSAYLGALGVLVALYPACAWYRRYKAAHPNGWARWI